MKHFDNLGIVGYFTRSQKVPAKTVCIISSRVDTRRRGSILYTLGAAGAATTTATYLLYEETCTVQCVKTC